MASNTTTTLSACGHDVLSNLAAVLNGYRKDVLSQVQAHRIGADINIVGGFIERVLARGMDDDHKYLVCILPAVGTLLS
jgi:hypothetical protein